MPEDKTALAPQGAGDGTTPKTESPPAKEPTEPKAAPAAGDTGEEQPEPGPIPYARFKEVNDKAKALETVFQSYFTVDPQTGQAVLRPEVLAQAAQPSQPKPDAQQAIQRFAERYGFLPEQVEGVLQLADYIADQKATQRTAPLLQATTQQVRDGLVKTAGVPPEAVGFVTKWVETAQKLNPYSLLTQEGRDTILRQAVGEFYLQQPGTGKTKGPTAPVLEGGGGGAPSGRVIGLPTEVEAVVRDMGLSDDQMKAVAQNRRTRMGGT